MWNFSWSKPTSFNSAYTCMIQNVVSSNPTPVFKATCRITPGYLIHSELHDLQRSGPAKRKVTYFATILFVFNQIEEDSISRLFIRVVTSSCMNCTKRSNVVTTASYAGGPGFWSRWWKILSRTSSPVSLCPGECRNLIWKKVTTTSNYI